MKVKSIERCLNIIELLSNKPDGMRLSDISSYLDLNVSTVHHILKTLSAREYVAQYPDTKRYTLGFQFLEISKKILDSIDIRKVAHPFLEELYNDCGENVHLSVLRSNKVVYIDMIKNPSGLSLATYIGFSTDPHAAAGGKVLLAAMSPQGLRELYKKRPLKKYQVNTISRMRDLLTALEKIRKDGYAVDDEEYYEGVRCVAAPIYSGKKAVASLSITGPIFSMTKERVHKELIRKVTEKAEEISSALW
jgi:DNA-binding IclR family transcriptional regulator